MGNKEIPEQLLNSLARLAGFNKPDFINAHNLSQATTSIRTNPKKQYLDFEIKEKVAWCENGFYLGLRPNFTADPLFHAGCYYVQEASSMFVEHIIKSHVDLKDDLTCLDLCAAPGGKSTHIASLISADSFLMANEVIKTRVPILVENITKWGCENVAVTNNDPKDFAVLKNYFDIIVVDAPCSGSGLFRKNKDAINEWSEENVMLCSHRQQRILADIIPSLKDNGVIIYSTCSYSPEENEQACDYIAEKFKLESLKIELDKSWGIVEVTSDKKKCFGYRFYPDKVRGEGFFVAAFRKAGGKIETLSKQKHSQKEITTAEQNVVNKWVQQPNDYAFIKNKNEIMALPKKLMMQYDRISSLYLKKIGVTIGELMNNDLIPSHELAMSNLASEKTQRVDVEKKLAISYLKREVFSLADAPKGWLLLTYKNQPLGWVKNLGNRINNYYPKNWRILKDVL